MTDNHHTNYVTTLTEERVREIVREEMACRAREWINTRRYIIGLSGISSGVVASAAATVSLSQEPSQARPGSFRRLVAFLKLPRRSR